MASTCEAVELQKVHREGGTDERGMMEHGREGKEGDSALPPFILRTFSLLDDVRERATKREEASCNITQLALKP